jgi:predicted MPP superfamily phosphohydrolase
MIAKINAQKPDLVDHNPLFVKAANIGPEFLKINAPLGMFAVAGNHEFIGHADVSINYLQNYGIQYVRDTVLIINDFIQVAGRDDRERRPHEGVARKPIETVLKTINPQLPLILMDHQPVEYDAAASFKVDLMVSGHTHKGQLWPFGYITKLIF